jgi:hypothetical protein
MLKNFFHHLPGIQTTGIKKINNNIMAFNKCQPSVKKTGTAKEKIRRSNCFLPSSGFSK